MEVEHGNQNEILFYSLPQTLSTLVNVRHFYEATTIHIMSHHAGSFSFHNFTLRHNDNVPCPID